MVSPSDSLSSKFNKNKRFSLFEFCVLISKGLIRVLSKTAHLSGFDSWEPIWKNDAHGKGLCSFIILAIVMTVNSLYLESPNKFEILKVSLGAGTIIQTMVKMCVIIAKGETYVKLRANIEKMYKSMEKVDAKRKALLEKCIKSCTLLVKILFFIDGAAVFLFLCIPIIKLLYVKEHLMIFPFYCPFVDHNSNIGYVINSIIHEFIVYYSFVFHVAFDSSFGLVVLQVAAKRHFLIMDFDDVEHFVVNTNLKMPVEQIQMRKKLRDLLISHKELCSYVKDIGDFYLIPCFLTITTSIASVCIGLILVIVIKWELGYGFAWIVMGQILICCVFGTIVYHQTVIINTRIWNFPWYLLNVSDQKSYLLMMLNAQQPINMEMKFIGRLDMETFTKVSGVLKFTLV